MGKMIKLESSAGPMWMNSDHIVHVGVPVDKQGHVLVGHSIVTTPFGQYIVAESPEEVAAKFNGEKVEKPRSILQSVN
jgi:hypothetical protein